MKIGVVGPGAIGLLYTFYLQKSNQDVTLFTRTAKQADELNITGVTCIREGKRETVFPPVLPKESMLDQQLDYIFIAVKQYYLLCEGNPQESFCKTECHTFMLCRK